MFLYLYPLFWQHFSLFLLGNSALELCCWKVAVGTQLWVAEGGHRTSVRPLGFPAALILGVIGISVRNVLACCPPRRMKPTPRTWADFVQQTYRWEQPLLGSTEQNLPFRGNQLWHIPKTSYCSWNLLQGVTRHLIWPWAGGSTEQL